MLRISPRSALVYAPATVPADLTGEFADAIADLNAN